MHVQINVRFDTCYKLFYDSCYYYYYYYYYDFMMYYIDGEHINKPH